MKGTTWILQYGAPNPTSKSEVTIVTHQQSLTIHTQDPVALLIISLHHILLIAQISQTLRHGRQAVFRGEKLHFKEHEIKLYVIQVRINDN